MTSPKRGPLTEADTTRLVRPQGGYIGRYAPSPTGPLHFGSLVAAVASYLDARANNGSWLLRMEDLDKPREMPGAADAILRTLDGYGFQWDGAVIYQSRRDEAYAAALARLSADERIYPCGCSRREIMQLAHAGIEGPVYPGTCRHGLANDKQARAWRIRVDEQQLSFSDAIQGEISHRMDIDIGDFVLKRADGLFAYQLAVVVDDAEQGVTDIVRGADLLNSTTRQMLLQQHLGLVTPRYAHVPIATNSAGQKLSKQTRASPIRIELARPTLLQVFAFLGLPVTDDLLASSLDDIWRWAIAQWRLERVPRAFSIELGSSR